MSKKKETETQAAQSERFRKAVCAAIDAGELNPTEADDASERLASSQALGSGLINHIQKMTVAALQKAQKKVWAHRS